MSNFQIAVLVGWALALWMLGSVLSSESTNFSNLGRSKLKWFLLSLAAFIPYFGFIAVLFYVFKVRVHFPPKPARQSFSRGASGPSHSSPGHPTGSTGSTYSSPAPRPTCTSCSGGKVRCYGCSNGYVYGTRTERHGPCGGTGYVRCQMCNGTGYR